MSDYTLNIVKAGWLFRLSDILKNWKKEWAIINTNGEMNFFKAPNKLVSLKKINLGIECHEILSYDECKHRLPDCTGEKCVFGFSNSDEYWFCAESEDDAIVWRLTIEQLMSLPPEPYRPAPLPPYTPAPPYGAPNAYYYQTPYPMNPATSNAQFSSSEFRSVDQVHSVHKNTIKYQYNQFTSSHIVKPEICRNRPRVHNLLCKVKSIPCRLCVRIKNHSPRAFSLDIAITRYPDHTLIPNALKATTEARELYLIKFSKLIPKRVMDMLGPFKIDPKTGRTGFKEVRFYLTRTPVSLSVYKNTLVEPTVASVAIITWDQVGCQDSFNDILISPMKVPCVMGIELIRTHDVPHPDLVNKDDWIIPTIDIGSWTIDKRESFIRQDLSLADIRDKVLFIQTEMAVSIDFTPLTVNFAAVDFNNNVLMNYLVTPRGRAVGYDEFRHGLKEQHLFGKMDEYDFLAKFRKLAKGRIIVGHNLPRQFQALHIHIQEIMGVRDLSGAPCLKENIQLQCSEEPFRFTKLIKMFIKISNPPKIHKALDGVKMVRGIYRAMEHMWFDSFGPAERLVQCSFGSLPSRAADKEYQFNRIPLVINTEYMMDSQIVDNKQEPDSTSQSPQFSESPSESIIYNDMKSESISDESYLEWDNKSSPDDQILSQVVTSESCENSPQLKTKKSTTIYPWNTESTYLTQKSRLSPSNSPEDLSLPNESDEFLIRSVDQCFASPSCDLLHTAEDCIETQLEQNAENPYNSEHYTCNPRKRTKEMEESIQNIKFKRESSME